MAAEKDFYGLPDGPKDLCFNKDDFIKNPFSVDEFLQNQRKNANLEIMRDDLGIYLKVLRSAMIELINKDYADFVNLSSNLIGLDKAIIRIQVPLGQLKEEVWQVKSSLDEAIAELTECLENQRHLQRSKQSLHSLTYVQQSICNLAALLHLPPSSIVDSGEESEKNSTGTNKYSSDPELIERVASELNQLHFRISYCSQLLAPEYKEQLIAIESVLTHSLDDLFLQSLHDSDLGNVSRCLCVYESLGKTYAAEELFQKRVVAKALHDVISEVSLQSNPDGLKGLFAQVLKFVDINMKTLLDITSDANRPSAVNGFHFLVNSFWPEVEKRLELHLSSIFAPGNPDNFFQNFTETQKFLRELEKKCGSQTEVTLLYRHPQYQAFLHLWNLPVYFQIRFQEIGGGVESALDNWYLNIKSENGRFLLTPTNAVWSAVQLCWNENVFLPQITHRLWKLTLQIFARYYFWTGEALSERKLGSQLTGHIGRLSFLVWLYSDILSLAECVPEVMEIASDGLGSLTEIGVDHCKASLKESEDQLLSRLSAVTERIVSEVSASSSASLRQVSDIPRLFRRTNRDVPTKPCPYMSAVVAPIREFHSSYSTVVSSDQLQRWLTLICSAVTCQLYACVSDVLTSVQKVEESLRRLKKMRERGGAASVAEGRGLTDDDKIRMQLAIDINSFRREVEELGVRLDDVERLNDLISLVESSMQAQHQH